MVAIEIDIRRNKYVPHGTLPHLRHEALKHTEEAALLEETRLREGDETLGAEGCPICVRDRLDK